MQLKTNKAENWESIVVLLRKYHGDVYFTAVRWYQITYNKIGVCQETRNIIW